MYWQNVTQKRLIKRSIFNNASHAVITAREHVCTESVYEKKPNMYVISCNSG